MSSESDDPKKPSGEPDPGSTVSVDLKDIPDARPATAPSEPLPELAAASAEPPASASGSVDVRLSNPELPAGSVPDKGAAPLESQPVSGSGSVVAAVASSSEGTGPARRSRRITGLVQDAVSAGVERLGAGIETVGEGVTKVGDLTKKVPLVGAGVGKLGEGLTKAGESIHALPAVTKTRRGRLLVRSVVVGFLLVFSWITVIVGFQLRTHDTPDFRPASEQILLQVSQGQESIEQVYDHSSPRFQEFILRDQFVHMMKDLNATNGGFREITAINETLVTTGPAGRVGRVSLTAAYDNGIARGSLSFHYDRGQWKLLGISIEVPRDREAKITETEREKRVAACLDDKGHDISDQRKCSVRDAFETILEKIRDDKAGEVFDNASEIFKKNEPGETLQQKRARFIQVQADAEAAIGKYKRILHVTEAKSIAGVKSDDTDTAAFVVVAEFERSSGVRVDADFSRPSAKNADGSKAPWQLRRFKIAVPMPRMEDQATSLVPPDPQVP
ncbi:MAG TPA: hypothetical protein VL326_27760 [Kofleriaceae bacterium]|nr:hypothetical protein [Kofleriaceae bacterium]